MHLVIIQKPVCTSHNTSMKRAPLEIPYHLVKNRVYRGIHCLSYHCWTTLKPVKRVTTVYVWSKCKENMAILPLKKVILSEKEGMKEGFLLHWFVILMPSLFTGPFIFDVFQCKAYLLCFQTGKAVLSSLLELSYIDINITFVKACFLNCILHVR